MDQGTKFMPGPLERKERKGEGKRNEGRGEEGKRVCTGKRCVVWLQYTAPWPWEQRPHVQVPAQPQTSIMYDLEIAFLKSQVPH